MFLAMLAMVCSTVSVTALSLRQEGLASLPVGTQRPSTHWVEFATDPDSPRPFPTVHTTQSEFIPPRPTMNWLEMATQTVTPPPPQLPIFEPFKIMEPPNLAVVTGDSSLRSLQQVASPTASPTTGVSVVSGPGSVTTGYAVISVAYAASDTACTGKFTYGFAYVLGVCVSSGTGGLIFTADVRFAYLFILPIMISFCHSCFLCVFCYFLQTSGAIYQSSYSSTTCSGSPTVTYKLASTYCGSCTASGCTSTWSYTSGLPTNGATYLLYSFTSSSSCSGSPYYIYAIQASSCTASSSCTSSSSGGYTTSCSTGSTPVGTITTGYFVTSANYGSDSTCSSTPASVSVYMLGNCIPNSAGGTMFTADNNGIIYQVVYSSTTCTGTVTQSSALPKKSCAASSSNSYSKGYYYSATIPSVGTGTTQTDTYYSGSGCTSTPYGATVQQTSACSTQSCAVSTGYSTSTTCSSNGVAATTVGTITTGYAIAYVIYATSDTTCSTPLEYNVYPLGTCLLYSSLSNSPTATGGVIGSADANGNIYATYYSSSTTCAGTPSSTSAVAKSGCTCSSTGCSTAFSYSATVPTLSGAYQTNTVYSGSSCGGTQQQIVLKQTSSCIAASCLSSGPSQSSSITCSGTATSISTSNMITTGYAVVNATYAASGESPPFSANNIYPL